MEFVFTQAFHVSLGRFSQLDQVEDITMSIIKETVKSVQSALSDLKRPPERLQSQCNYQPFIT